jgi:aminoglycoside 6'-N-acetyltransferase
MSDLSCRSLVTMKPIMGQAVKIVEPGDDELQAMKGIRRHPEIIERWGPGDEVAGMLAILVAGTVVGAIQFHEEDDPAYRHAGIDLFIDPACHRRGYGSDAVRALARWLFAERGHHRITIDPAAANTPAIRCYEKVGFRPVGIMRRYERVHEDQDWHDGLLMDLLAEDLLDPPAS